MERKHRNDLESGNTQSRFKGNQQRKSVNRSDYCLRRLGMPACSRWKSVTLRAIMSLTMYLRCWLGIRGDEIIGLSRVVHVRHISSIVHGFFLIPNERKLFSNSIHLRFKVSLRIRPFFKYEFPFIMYIYIWNLWQSPDYTYCTRYKVSNTSENINFSDIVYFNISLFGKISFWYFSFRRNVLEFHLGKQIWMFIKNRTTQWPTLF